MSKDKKNDKDHSVAYGVAAVGSAAIAAALLYAGRRFMKKPEDKASQSKIPSGEPPQTD